MILLVYIYILGYRISPAKFLALAEDICLIFENENQGVPIIQKAEQFHQESK